MIRLEKIIFAKLSMSHEDLWHSATRQTRLLSRQEVPMVYRYSRGVIKSMECSKFEFHLTGSRYFGTERSDSDWDFFVESQPGLIDWLVTHGFCKDSVSYNLSASQNITEVWKHESEKVHIQICRDLWTRYSVQDALRDFGYGDLISRTTKDQRRLLWDLAFDLFEAGRQVAASE